MMQLTRLLNLNLHLHLHLHQNHLSLLMNLQLVGPVNSLMSKTNSLPAFRTCKGQSNVYVKQKRTNGLVRWSSNGFESKHVGSG
ncbi:hypothetical protein Hanom_Chr14g01275541 [Helianthus anomalus]